MRGGSQYNAPMRQMRSDILRLDPGQFFGGASLSCSGGGFQVSHRIADCDPDAVPAHTHDDAHFILVTGGEYVSSAGGRPAQSLPALIYNPPGTTHRDHFRRGRGSFLAISLHPEAAAAALGSAAVPADSRHLSSSLQRALVAQIVLSCRRHPVDLSVQALCLELLGTMEQCKSPEPSAPPAWLAVVLELLNDRYADCLTIGEIAGIVGVHPIHLARTFRRHFRCTPGAFQRFRRLERAAGLLAHTTRPLADVALNTGFADQSHFTRSFALGFGIAPGE